MKVLFDTNVILDAVLARVPFVENAAYLMVMVSVKFMSIPWKAFGHFCGLGYDLIVVYLKKSYLCIWASLSLFIMPRGGGKLC
jgi:hypothetical protein